ncbi:TonB-dependent receptor domain-containing protein [Psychromonas sp. 14N.309.X.WAT.B.A12]|jgi:hemoglobin/transferrin/lactoferrin receptor protein|uniref:TonB-dependent receptor domain-containing protein n=1 Tax=unclassified Psychromonas TaxID=2614957 RepID=UPI0025AED2AC|nr:TonB-dependent receptor [Psychromonas sp. 14N.309.X.WAT.B.A12]MDN2663621.1 TonB-dependent receptor [Psychromonas sp. 14N.309.X.WAT.B.A12]
MHNSLPFKRLPITIMISSVLSASAFATESEISTATTYGVVEVWGTQINNETSLLTHDIESKQAHHVSVLLRDQAGVDVGGSHSLNQSINIRGVTETDLNITIDGADQSNNVFHHVGNLLINPDILQSVDLQVGTNSIINGGLSGGVAFETKDADDLLREGETVGARIYGGYADNDYYSYSGTVYSRINEHFDFLAYYNAIDRNNSVDGEGNEKLGQEGKMQNILLKAGFNFSDSNRLELSYDYYDDSGDYALRTNLGAEYDPTGAIYDISYNRETITLNHELSLAQTQINSTLYSNTMTYNPDYGEGSTNNEGITNNIGFKVLAETDVQASEASYTLRYGIEGQTQDAERTTDGERVGNKESTKSIAVYAENEIALTDKLLVTPGVRYDVYAMDANSSDETFKEVSFALAAEYMINDQWTTRASATELFQGPALPGSFLSTVHDDNPDLKAETGINYELGLSYETLNFAGMDTFGFSVTLFETQIDDYIDNSITGKVGIENLGDVQIKGVESSVNMRKGQFTSRLTYSHSDSEYTDVNEDANSDYLKTVGQALDNEVGDSFSLNLGYTFPSVNVKVNWTSMVTLDLHKDVSEDTSKAGYDVHDLSIQWMPKQVQDLTLTAGIDNIFDEQYASHASNYTSLEEDRYTTDYEPGRNIKISASYQF